MNLELSSILTDREKNELGRFVDNDDMFKAVKKVVLASIYFDGTLKKEGVPDPLKNFLLALGSQSVNGTLTREQLGEKVETSLAGVQLVETGFRELEKYKKRKEPRKAEANPGR